MAVDVDLVPPSRPGVVYQGGSTWNVVFITSIVGALLAVALVLWYFASTASLKKQVSDLGARVAANEQQIMVANALPASATRPATTVEQRSSDLVTTVNTFQTLLNSRQVWSRVLPIISAHTLQGVSLTGMNIDEKLTVKIDGVSHAAVLGSDQVTPFGMIARQVVAFRDALDDSLAKSVSTASSSSPKTTGSTKVFSSVTLGSLSESVTPGSKGSAAEQIGHFSITVTLNPVSLKDAASAGVNQSKATP